MVRNSNLQFDESLMEGEKKRSRARGWAGGGPGEPKVHVYAGRVDNALAISIVLAVGLLVLLGFTAKKENWFAVVLLGLMFLASELFALPMKPAGRLSLALLPLVMAMMISGPLGTAVVAAFGLPIFFMERGPQGWKRVVFNTAQLVFAAGAAAFVFRHTGGNILDATLKNGGKLVLPWILATLVFFVFNTLLVMPVLAPEGNPLLRFWQRRLLPKLPGYILYSGIGFLAAVMYVKLEFPAVVLVFAPLLAIRVVYTRYGTMRDVCDDTTLAIMEAVEGGSMFMEGHAIGVADIAVAMAEEMDFAEEDVHVLRQAALLHDIGKLALDPSIVDKPGALTPEEYDEIKKHPLVGATIVSKEASFSGVAPSIRHHHEMTDGGGYPDGLSADTIPLGARILAVADAFDAMQRPVPFRQPMSAYDAASEVVRSKGIQFDPAAVDAFTKVAIRRGIWAGALKDRVRMPVKKTDQAQMAMEDLEQPTLAEGVPESSEPGTKPMPSGATPADGISYEQVRSEIEQDVRDWERSESGERRRAREPRKKTGSRKKKSQEGKGPKAS
ncbi:MAG TPA: HD-GYP domain-containing protein [Candidatus Anoxymicrobiaceae bacterium]